jgi:hypothetical protein
MRRTTEVPPLQSLERWLLAINFRARAEEAASGGSPTDHTIAVILADTAAESALALLASLDGDPPNDHFPTLLNAAIKAVRDRGIAFPVHLGRNLTAAHLTRNNAVHHGTQVSESSTSVDSTRRLIGLLSAVAPMYPDVPAGSGLLGAVAALIAPANEVSELLVEAQRLAGEGAWSPAAEAGSQALHRARSLSTPNIKVNSATIPYLDKQDRGLVAPIYGRLELIETWLVPIALGLRPADYAAMDRALGFTIEDVTGRMRSFSYGDDVEPAAIEKALELLAEVIVRLWATGRMYRGTKAEFDATWRSHLHNV